MISERQDKILALIQKRGRISIRELQELLLVDEIWTSYQTKG